MPSTVGETFYDLAIRSLEEQEREVASLRARTGTLAAAAAVAATVLAEEALGHGNPGSRLDWAVTAIGLLALIAVLLASVYLLWSHRLAFSVDAGAAIEDVETSPEAAADDLNALHVSLADSISAMRATNRDTVRKLGAAFSVASSSFVIETLGLGLGAALR
jgi:hypothetical protein